MSTTDAVTARDSDSLTPGRARHVDVGDVLHSINCQSEEEMNFSGEYYDLSAEPIMTSSVIVRGGGDEIAFDFSDHFNNSYTVVLRRVNGSLFKGTANLKFSNDIADVTCRVYKDSNEGVIIILGSQWKSATDPANYRWLVQLESEG